MPLEEFRIQIAMLLDSISRQPGDMHEMQETLREKLAEMQSLGLPLPEDLVGLEQYLDSSLDKSAPPAESPGQG